MKFYQKHRKLSTWILAFLLVASLILFKQILAAVPMAISVIKNLLSILSPFITGFIIAFLLYVPCSKIEKLLGRAKKPNFFSKHKRGISVLSVYIIFVAIIAVILALVVPWVVKNLIILYNNRSSYYMTVIDFIHERCDEHGKLFGIDPSPIIEILNPDRYLSEINLDKLTSIANGVYKFGSAIIETILAVFSALLARRMWFLRTWLLLSYCRSSRCGATYLMNIPYLSLLPISAKEVVGLLRKICV